MVQTATTGSPPPLHSISAENGVALFLDFDGTLIEIASGPEAILVPDGLAARLEALSHSYNGRLALVSGRSIANIAHHLGPVAIARAGSHGAEQVLPDGSPLGIPPHAIPPVAADALRAYASLYDGLEFEEKSHGAAIHYRAAPQLEALVIGFAGKLAEDHGLAVKRGKCVAELVNRGVDKASAVRAFMAQANFAGAMPIFVGDDITDEDGFRAASAMGGFGVIVGDRPNTAARYRLETPAKVIEWLTL